MTRIKLSHKVSLLDNTRCVVLNSTYEPLSIRSARRGLILCLKGKAKIVEEMDVKINDKWSVPTQVVLLRYVKNTRLRHTVARLDRKNLFIRDKHTCQYCSRTNAELTHNEKLTRDHVIPRHKGGKTRWENIVTACSTCNSRKGNKNLEDSGMELLSQPYIPTIYDIMMLQNRVKI